MKQMKLGYIKGDHTKHTSPKFFNNQQQQAFLKIQVNQVNSEDNVVDLFTKSLPKAIFEKHVRSIGMRRFCKLHLVDELNNGTGVDFRGSRTHRGN